MAHGVDARSEADLQPLPQTDVPQEILPFVHSINRLLQRLNAEAEGLGKKFGALDALSDSARQHEEFRMQLEKSFEEAMAAIAANKEIAKDQAEVLATALGKAKIEIVGGEGDFFNSFAKSLSVGKAIEGVVGKSPVVQDVLARLLNGKPAERKADVEVPAAEA